MKRGKEMRKAGTDAVYASPMPSPGIVFSCKISPGKARVAEFRWPVSVTGVEVVKDLSASTLSAASRAKSSYDSLLPTRSTEADEKASLSITWQRDSKKTTETTFSRRNLDLWGTHSVKHVGTVTGLRCNVEGCALGVVVVGVPLTYRRSHPWLHVLPSGRSDAAAAGDTQMDSSSGRQDPRESHTLHSSSSSKSSLSNLWASALISLARKLVDIGGRPNSNLTDLLSLLPTSVVSVMQRIECDTTLNSPGAGEGVPVRATSRDIEAEDQEAKGHKGDIEMSKRDGQTTPTLERVQTLLHSVEEVTRKPWSIPDWLQSDDLHQLERAALSPFLPPSLREGLLSTLLVLSFHPEVGRGTTIAEAPGAGPGAISSPLHSLSKKCHQAPSSLFPPSLPSSIHEAQAVSQVWEAAHVLSVCVDQVTRKSAETWNWAATGNALSRLVESLLCGAKTPSTFSLNCMSCPERHLCRSCVPALSSANTWSALSSIVDGILSVHMDDTRSVKLEEVADVLHSDQRRVLEGVSNLLSLLWSYPDSRYYILQQWGDGSSMLCYVQELWPWSSPTIVFSLVTRVLSTICVYEELALRFIGSVLGGNDATPTEKEIESVIKDLTCCVAETGREGAELCLSALLSVVFRLLKLSYAGSKHQAFCQILDLLIHPLVPCLVNGLVACSSSIAEEIASLVLHSWAELSPSVTAARPLKSFMPSLSHCMKKAMEEWDQATSLTILLSELGDRKQMIGSGDDPRPPACDTPAALWLLRLMVVMTSYPGRFTTAHSLVSREEVEKQRKTLSQSSAAAALSISLKSQSLLELIHHLILGYSAKLLGRSNGAQLRASGDAKSATEQVGAEWISVLMGLSIKPDEVAAAVSPLSEVQQQPGTLPARYETDGGESGVVRTGDSVMTTSGVGKEVEGKTLEETTDSTEIAEDISHLGLSPSQVIAILECLVHLATQVVDCCRLTNRPLPWQSVRDILESSLMALSLAMQSSEKVEQVSHSTGHANDLRDRVFLLWRPHLLSTMDTQEHGRQRVGYSRNRTLCSNAWSMLLRWSCSTPVLRLGAINLLGDAFEKMATCCDFRSMARTGSLSLELLRLQWNGAKTSPTVGSDGGEEVDAPETSIFDLLDKLGDRESDDFIDLPHSNALPTSVDKDVGKDWVFEILRGASREDSRGAIEDVILDLWQSQVVRLRNEGFASLAGLRSLALTCLRFLLRPSSRGVETETHETTYGWGAPTIASIVGTSLFSSSPHLITAVASLLSSVARHNGRSGMWVLLPLALHMVVAVADLSLACSQHPAVVSFSDATSSLPVGAKSKADDDEITKAAGELANVYGLSSTTTITALDYAVGQSQFSISPFFYDHSFILRGDGARSKVASMAKVETAPRAEATLLQPRHWSHNAFPAGEKASGKSHTESHEDAHEATVWDRLFLLQSLLGHTLSSCSSTASTQPWVQDLPSCSSVVKSRLISLGVLDCLHVISQLSPSLSAVGLISCLGGRRICHSMKERSCVSLRLDRKSRGLQTHSIAKVSTNIALAAGEELGAVQALSSSLALQLVDGGKVSTVSRFPVDHVERTAQILLDIANVSGVPSSAALPVQALALASQPLTIIAPNGKPYESLGLAQTCDLHFTNGTEERVCFQAAPPPFPLQSLLPTASTEKHGLVVELAAGHRAASIFGLAASTLTQAVLLSGRPSTNAELRVTTTTIAQRVFSACTLLHCVFNGTTTADGKTTTTCPFALSSAIAAFCQPRDASCTPLPGFKYFPPPPSTRTSSAFFPEALTSPLPILPSALGRVLSWVLLRLRSVLIPITDLSLWATEEKEERLGARRLEVEDHLLTCFCILRLLRLCTGLLLVLCHGAIKHDALQRLSSIHWPPRIAHRRKQKISEEVEQKHKRLPANDLMSDLLDDLASVRQRGNTRYTSEKAQSKSKEQDEDEEEGDVSDEDSDSLPGRWTSGDIAALLEAVGAPDRSAPESEKRPLPRILEAASSLTLVTVRIISRMISMFRSTSVKVRNAAPVFFLDAHASLTHLDESFTLLKMEGTSKLLGREFLSKVTAPSMRHTETAPTRKIDAVASLTDTFEIGITPHLLQSLRSGWSELDVLPNLSILTAVPMPQRLSEERKADDETGAEVGSSSSMAPVCIAGFSTPTVSLTALRQSNKAVLCAFTVDIPYLQVTSIWALYNELESQRLKAETPSVDEPETIRTATSPRLHSFGGGGRELSVHVDEFSPSSSRESRRENDSSKEREMLSSTSSIQSVQKLPSGQDKELRSSKGSKGSVDEIRGWSRSFAEQGDGNEAEEAAGNRRGGHQSPRVKSQSRRLDRPHVDHSASSQIARQSTAASSESRDIARHAGGMGRHSRESEREARQPEGYRYGAGMETPPGIPVGAARGVGLGRGMMNMGMGMGTGQMTPMRMRMMMQMGMGMSMGIPGQAMAAGYGSQFHPSQAFVAQHHPNPQSQPQQPGMQHSYPFGGGGGRRHEQAGYGGGFGQGGKRASEQGRLGKRRKVSH